MSKYNLIILVLFFNLLACSNSNKIKKAWAVPSNNSNTSYLVEMSKFKLKKVGDYKVVKFKLKNKKKQICTDTKDWPSPVIFRCVSPYPGTEIEYMLSIFSNFPDERACGKEAYEYCKNKEDCFCVRFDPKYGRGDGPEEEVGTGEN